MGFSEKRKSFKSPWRERLRKAWRENKWFVIAGLWILAVVLGYMGFSRYYSSLGESQSAWQIFYNTIQLFVLESGAATGPLVWQLEVARFLAPAVTVFTAITVIAVVFYEQLLRLRLSFIKGHVVVCGLGRKGLILAREFHKKYAVVVIEKDENNPLLDQCRSQGIIVLIGYASDPAMLAKAKAHKAKYLISVCRDDGVNADVAVYARELMDKRRGGMFTCLVHIVDLQLCNLIREQEIYMSKADNFRLEFFNIFESGARTLLNQYSAFDETGEETEYICPHPLVVGIGQMGQSIVVNAAKRWSQRANSTGERLRISILDRDAERIKESLQLQHPELDEIWKLMPLQMDIDSPDYQRAYFICNSKGERDVTIVYICLDDEPRALSAALTLLKRIREQEIPIVVRMVHDSGLSSLLKGEMADQAFANLYAFGLLDQTCKTDLLFAGTNEILAQAIHDDYVRDCERKGYTPETNPSMLSWEELSEGLKESNRRQADHIGKKLKEVGCGIEPLMGVGEEPCKFTTAEIETLAEMEHKRWMDERMHSGWRYIQGPKDIEEKRSPYLIPWEQLPENIKELDRNMIRGLPAFLARAGFQIYRKRSNN